MSHETIGEQLVILGGVDVPLNNDNTMKALGVLGIKGYMPTVVQEVNLQDGRSVNRLSLISPTSNASIIFNQNRIVLSRTPGPDGVMRGGDFLGLAKEVCQDLDKTFPLRANRFVLVGEKMLVQKPVEEMQDICKKFIGYGSDLNPFEWLSRTSSIIDGVGGKVLRVVEINRAQGVMVKSGVEANFDRIRAKIEIGTDMEDTQDRFSLEVVAEMLSDFNSLLGDAFREVEQIHGN